MTKKYLSYLWKKSYKFILICLFVGLLLYPVTMLVQGEPYLLPFTYWEEVLVEGEYYYESITTDFYYINSYETMLYMPTILIVSASYLIPIVVAGTFQNKKRCDNLFSLPIRREKQIFITSAYGYLMTVAVWLVTVLVGLGTSYAVGLNYDITYFFLYVACMLLLSVGVYGTSTLCCSLLNNTVDSVLNVLIAVAIGPMFAMMLSNEFYRLPFDAYLFTTPVYAADEITSFFQERIGYHDPGLMEFIKTLDQSKYNFNTLYYTDFPLQHYLTLGANFIGGAICYGLSSLLWRNVKAEEMQTPSKKWYGYPIGISLLGFVAFYFFSPATMLDNFETCALFLAIFIVAYFVAFFIFQRKIRFNKTNLIAFGVTFVGSQVFALLCNFI